MQTPRDPTPRMRFHLLPFVWFFCALTSVGMLLLAGFIASEWVRVPQSQVFSGTLTPNRDPIELPLPAGVPLKAVLVKSGDRVRAGQTVATLDIVAMQATLETIERRIAVAHVLRRCLLETVNTKDFGTERIASALSASLAANANSSDDPELAVLVKAAELDCETDRKAETDKIIRLERGLELLQERLILVNQKLTMLLGARHTAQNKSQKTEVNPLVRAHASVSVALERNTLAQKVQALTDELASLRTTQDQARLARIKSVSETVAAQLTQQAVLKSYLEQPRLTLPEGGRISRVRPIPVGKSFAGDEVLMEIHSANATRYVAELRVPLAQIQHLPIGTKVRVSLAGFTQRGPKLTGQIKGWTEGDSATGHHFAMARIDLSEESQMLLSDPRNGIALRGATTASVIHAHLDAVSLQENLSIALREKTEWMANTLRRVAFDG